MREQLQQRLEQLRAEFEKGREMLADLDQRRLELGNTLQRLQGAILVLEELVAEQENVREVEN